ncbi:MAG TPA: hypothetical protein VFQ45_21265 [Longimicrobium sp.]|nr:hypothetical protein [Longimicrobium sp.]
MSDTLPSSSTLSGQITFDQYFAPRLESGDYAVTVQQRVASSDADNAFDETFETQLTFAVLGPRFSLPPGYVSQVFPPADAQGEYSNVLPHLVSPIKTLPWQRAAQEPGTSYPWLALLTFDGDDPAPGVASGTVADLQSPPDGVVSYPGLELEYGESAGDPVQYVDVPAALFTEIAPRLDELAWLAHGRTLDGDSTDRKADNSDGSSPGTDFSAVMGNRLPAPGSRTVCCLVSVEGMAELLPPATLDAEAVRLAVLYTWSFGSVDLGETFREYFEELDDPPYTLQVPYTASAVSNPAVQAALEMGYVAVSHHTRQGADTVSWYRGPLLPFANPQYVAAPFTSSDALTRYDPATGMFDVSLAAAWQLGQLLALADKPFATTLYAWKRGEAQAAAVAMQRQVLADSLDVDVSKLSATGIPAHVQMMREVFRPMLSSFAAARGGGS